MMSEQKPPTELPDDPIGFYSTIIFLALMFALVFAMLLIRVPALAALNPLLAILFGWLLSGLVLCLLLYAWSRNRRGAMLILGVLALFWIVGLARHARGETAPLIIASVFDSLPISLVLVSRLLVVVLALLIPVLAALIFLRPMEGMFAALAGLTWGVLWLLLFFLLGEYRAGLLLLISLVLSNGAFLALLYFSTYLLLPSTDKQNRMRMFGFVRDVILKWNFPIHVVVSKPGQEDKVEKRISGSTFTKMASGSGFVICDCDHAVVISAGPKFKGVKGPGVIPTGYGDTVVQVIDLRPHLKITVVEALTKDGIKIEAPAATACKIDARNRQPALGEPLPYNKTAAFKAIRAQRTEHEGGDTRQRMWYELPGIAAEHALQDLIGEYTFDELYGPHQPGGHPPRKVIAGKFSGQVKEAVEPLGIDFIGGGVSDLQPMDLQIYTKRVKIWQTEWARKVTLKQAEGQAEWLRTVERARAEAQADLILNLGRKLEDLSTSKTESPPERVLEQLVIILDQLTGQPAVQNVLPEDTMQGVMYIREAFGD